MDAPAGLTREPHLVGNMARALRSCETKTRRVVRGQRERKVATRGVDKPSLDRDFYASHYVSMEGCHGTDKLDVWGKAERGEGEV